MKSTNKKSPKKLPLALIRQFARSRAGAKKMSSFVNGNFVDFWIARVANRNVCTSRKWRHNSRGAALKVAREFIEHCKRTLAKRKAVAA